MFFFLRENEKNKDIVINMKKKDISSYKASRSAYKAALNAYNTVLKRIVNVRRDLSQEEESRDMRRVEYFLSIHRGESEASVSDALKAYLHAINRVDVIEEGLQVLYLELYRKRRELQSAEQEYVRMRNLLGLFFLF
ncbi:MAG: hypothetical protein QXX55_01470 [Candidatus Pacearchaeota archaeon]